MNRIAVSEPNPSRRRLVEALGVPTVDPSDEGISTAVAAALGGEPTTVIDAVGLRVTIDTAFEVAPLGSTIVLVGMGATELALRCFEVSTKERTLVGSFCYSAEEFRATARWVGSAPSELGLLIEGHTDLDGASDAFAALARSENPASKVLVLPQE